MSGEERISAICKAVPEFKKLYNARVRHYIIKEHILNVYNEFEKYFAQHFQIKKIEEFRLFLLLHDIGKSIAYEQGNRNMQYNVTLNELENHQLKLGISSDDFCLYKALLNASLIGRYMEGKLSLDETYAAILLEHNQLKTSLSSFFYFLSVYYQCDVASYTKDAGGLEYLEHLFQYQNGAKIYDQKVGLLKFRQIYESRYNILLEKIQQNYCETNSEIELEKDSNLATQDINIKVVGKIDLSKFERTQKEIKKDKVNYYIIDTNVFVDYPEIIEKIRRDYIIVLSAKVIDELDKLKNTLDKNGQRRVQKALRSINLQIDKRDVKLEMADLDLLPADFNKKSADNFILSVLLKFSEDNPILMTSDNGLQIKAKGMGISTVTLKEFIRGI